ncbi:lysine--tRNA ligase [Dissulfurispira thermophila]|uniref:Lysine--tRNA ligase n=1 Tax=Dissulfurispira thermophila TaxID=2715679 RepID=A0A7G1H3X9_9BACT|nr:lysine--tRNA ligase [Dissulfurispira thermophila]BCB96879.1 lysine--tRNA ligase [Dissulfurispira thermophila]
MEETNELIEQRFKKLDELRKLGIDPYNGRFTPDSTAAGLKASYGDIPKEDLETDPVNVAVAGRIIAMRDFGKASFAHIQDATGKIQIYLKKDVIGEKYSLIKKLDIGDIIGVNGRLFRTKTNELTVEVRDFVFLSKSLRPLPEKWHGLKDIELRYRQRYVDLIVNPDVKEVFAKRSAIIKAMRDFFESHGFIEVETPMMHPIPGGAAAKPFKTHHIALGMDLYLRIAPELYLKRLLVGGYERVFELNKNFRNEGISTKHNPEFTMLEFYMAYKDYNFLMSFTEEIFSYVANSVLGTLKVPYGDVVIDLTPPWPRIPMLDALKQNGVPDDVITDPEKAKKWAESKKIDIDKGASHAKVLDEIFKEFIEPELVQPVFIIDYPVELSPLAKRKKDNPDLVERFELFIASREIANAFSELNDPVDQRERFLKQVEAKKKGDEEAHWMDEDFVKALEYGMPPAAGEGIGIDRLIMLLTNSQSIRDVILFPQLKPEQ